MLAEPLAGAAPAAPPPAGLDSMLRFGAFQVRFCAMFWFANLFAESAWYRSVHCDLPGRSL